jgi:hypothetical protein
MTTKETVFQRTYEDYVAQLNGIDDECVEQNLGVQVQGNEITIPFFGKPYKVSDSGIAGPSGRKPTLDICVILCRYLLLCTDVHPREEEWVSFRDLKDSAPLTDYFANNVERAIATHFAGKLRDMEEASKRVGGYPPTLEVTYDLVTQFDALPRIPIIMLYNDVDDEFPAKCSVLFELRAERYLDAECLAMVGTLLFINLKKAESVRPTR